MINLERLYRLRFLEGGVVFEIEYDDEGESESSPERNLLAATLYRALLDLLDESRLIYGPAYRWCVSNEVASFTFIHCCEELSIDPKSLRKQIVNLYYFTREGKGKSKVVSIMPFLQRLESHSKNGKRN